MKNNRVKLKVENTLFKSIVSDKFFVDGEYEIKEYRTINLGEDGNLVLYFKSDFEEANKKNILNGGLLLIEKGKQVKRIMDLVLADEKNKYTKPEYSNTKRRKVGFVNFIDEKIFRNSTEVCLFLNKVRSYFNSITNKKILIDINCEDLNKQDYTNLKTTSFTSNSKNNHIELMSQIRDFSNELDFVEALCLALNSVSRYDKSSKVPKSLRKAIYLLGAKIEYLGYGDENFNKDRNYRDIYNLTGKEDIEIIKENLSYWVIKTINNSTKKESKYDINIFPELTLPNYKNILFNAISINKDRLSI